MSLATRRAICIAYCLEYRAGKNYHARAYIIESGFPGLPDTDNYKSRVYVGNDSESVYAAERAALRALLDEWPDARNVSVFRYGRQSRELVESASVLGYHGRNRCAGIAGAMV